MKNKYAKLLLEYGVNLQNNQPLVVTATTEINDFCSILTDVAFEMGASDVTVIYEDDKITRKRFEKASLESIDASLQATTDKLMRQIENGACYVKLLSSHPEKYAGIDQERMKNILLYMRQAAQPLREGLFNGDYRTVYGVVPGLDWANDLFPNEEDPIEIMWQMIYKSVHLEDGWDKHASNLLERAKKLTELNIEELHFTNNLGTDCTIGLCDDVTWATAEFEDQSARKYWCNIPTEEVGTVPHRMKVNGKVVASLPLYYNGHLIDGIEIIFRDGQVVDFHASKNKEILATIINTDEGSKRLGEVALVPFDSCVNNTGVLYKTTLFDENARCHLALGAGYPKVIGGSDRSLEGLVSKGLNVSAVHVDFMFGTSDLKCVAKLSSGDKLVIMEKGNVVI